MKLVVGLGNPGEKYRNNRHNVGFMVIDTLVSHISKSQSPIPNFQLSKKGKTLYTWIRLGGEKIELIKPQNFVNDTGYSVAYVYKKHSEINPEDTYVIYDDLDLQLGSYKIQKGKGPKDHKGLLSIYEKTGKSNFWHVRVGVDNRKKFSLFGFQYPKKIPGEKYVLQNFTEREVEILQLVIDNIVSDMSSKLID